VRVCSDCDEARSKVRCGISSSDDVSGQCVDVRAWCNGSADCDDASDETLCNTGDIGSLGQSSQGQVMSPRGHKLALVKKVVNFM